MVNVASATSQFGLVVLIMMLGYISGKSKYITVKKEEFGQVLSRIVLPTLFFYSFATFNLSKMSIAAIIGGMIACFITMFVCLAMSWVLNYKKHIDYRLKQWAIYSIFITMSYDMSIGLTLSNVLWSSNDESIDYSNYIVVWSAISRIATLIISIGVLDFAVLIEKEVWCQCLFLFGFENSNNTKQNLKNNKNKKQIEADQSVAHIVKEPVKCRKSTCFNNKTIFNQSCLFIHNWWIVVKFDCCIRK